MAIRTIRLDSDPILRRKSRKIDDINERITELLDDMLETMYDANGVGLAAPQIGVLRRAVVIDIGEGPIKIINPEIISTEGSIEGQEGCLSVTGFSGTVERPESVLLKYTDENNEEKTLEAQGYLARAIFHEYDHLEGILYTDKATKMFEVLEEDEEVEEHGE